MKKVISLLLALLMIVSMMVACGQGSTEQTEIPGENNAAAPVTPDTQTPAEEGSPQQYGDTLRVIIGTGVPSQLGYTPELSANSALTFMTASYESLVTYDKNGALVPLLAESWEIDPEEPSVTWTLRSGVTFADGEPFNAEAVKKNVEAYQSYSRSEVASVKEMVIIDDTHIKMVLSNWNSAIVESIGFYVYYMSPAAMDDKDAMYSTTCGTGPFQLKSFDGVTAIYEKNENYWQEGKPYLDSVQITNISEATTSQAAFLSGDADMWFGINGSRYSQLQAVCQADMDSGKIVTEMCESGRGIATVGIIPNSSDPSSPWANEKVRQALCYAIDPQACIDVNTFGLGQETNQWALPGSAEYNEDLNAITYNPDKARELLAEAGYPDGFTTTVSYFASVQNLFVAVVGMLEEVGIHCETEVIDVSAHNSYMHNGNWPGLMMHSATVGDLGLYMARHYSEGATFYYGGLQQNDEIHEYLEKIQLASDDAEKVALEHELQELIYGVEGNAIFGKPLYGNRMATAKYSYVHDDQASVNHSNTICWADAWIEK